MTDPEPVPAPRAKSGRPAVFLDRDGTLIEDVDYLSDPADIRIIPGVAEALVRLERSGFARVIVTNQSAVGRGMITEEQLGRIHDEMIVRFRELGVSLDAIYFCPEAPVGRSEVLVEHEDRKPGPGMLKRAASDLDLDLGASWMVGDKLSDVLAGFNAGCRGSILLRTGKGRDATPGMDRSSPRHYPVVDDLSAAADLIVSHEQMSRRPADP